MLARWARRRKSHSCSTLLTARWPCHRGNFKGGHRQTVVAPSPPRQNLAEGERWVFEEVTREAQFFNLVNGDTQWLILVMHPGVPSVTRPLVRCGVLTVSLLTDTGWGVYEYDWVFKTWSQILLAKTKTTVAIYTANARTNIVRPYRQSSTLAWCKIQLWPASNNSYEVFQNLAWAENYRVLLSFQKELD